MNFTDEYIDMYRDQKRPYALIDGQLFVRNAQRIAPVGPVAKTYSLGRAQCGELLSKLGGLWVQWTDGFGAHANESDWYAVICRRHTDLANIESGNTRSKLRRGLKNCEVRKVNAEEVALRGYETYRAALEGYGLSTKSILSEFDFESHERNDAAFPEIRHQWAVYIEGKMVGFTHNLIYDKTEVDYTMIKLHPAYLKHYTSYALIYKMNEYYLDQQGFEYVSDGARSILHETGVQDFLIQKFGFEKAYMNLHVYFRPPLGIALKMARPFRKLLSKVSPKLAAVMELDRVAVNR